MEIKKVWESLALVEMEMSFRDFIGDASLLIRFVIVSRCSPSVSLSFST